VCEILLFQQDSAVIPRLSHAKKGSAVFQNRSSTSDSIESGADSLPNEALIAASHADAALTNTASAEAIAFRTGFPVNIFGGRDGARRGFWISLNRDQRANELKSPG
jgi:hypothetical protein